MVSRHRIELCLRRFTVETRYQPVPLLKNVALPRGIAPQPSVLQTAVPTRYTREGRRPPTDFHCFLFSFLPFLCVQRGQRALKLVGKVRLELTIATPQT